MSLSNTSTTTLTRPELSRPRSTTDTILAVGDDATLTLGTDALIIVDDTLRSPPRSARTCFGLVSHKSVSSQSIPYYHVLSGQLVDHTLQIKYTKPGSTKKSTARLQVCTLRYTIAASEHELGCTQKWLARLLQSAYGPAVQIQKRVKVLINPYGGAGRALSIYRTRCAAIFEAAGCTLSTCTTQYRGHATEIARDIDIDEFDVIVCASGDGLPMEVFNGLAQKPNAGLALRTLAVAQLPCGTGNAMSLNLNGTSEPSQAALAIVKGVKVPLDLASITQLSDTASDGGVTRTLSFLSQSLGIVAESDLGTDNIRWMGEFRFTFGFLVRLLGKTVYPVEYAVKTEIEDKDEIKRHYRREIAKASTQTLDPIHDVTVTKQTEPEREVETDIELPPLRYGTVADRLPQSSTGWSPLTSYPNLGNFYLGNMCYMASSAPFFPSSLPSDGMLDLITIDGDISRLAALRLLLSVESGRLFDHPLVRVRKVSGVRVYPRYATYSHDNTNNKKSDNNSNLDINDTSVSSRSSRNSRNRQKKKSQGQKEGHFAVDGEKLPFQPFQVEIHRGLGRVLAARFGRYEYEFDTLGEDLSDSNPR